MENIIDEKHLETLKYQSTTINNCDREAIHIPGFIQSFGFMIVLNKSDLTITQVSENIVEFINHGLNDLIGKHITQILPVYISEFIENNDYVIKTQTNTELLQIELRDPHDDISLYGIIIHTLSERLILEFQPKSDLPSNHTNHLIYEAMQVAQKSFHLEQLYQTIVDYIQNMIGFDRVMLYKFDPDGNGAVVAEKLMVDRESYLGLHYPSTDIPKQARELYKKNILRIISDVNSTAVKLFPEFDSLNGLPLDMSNSILRNVSPIHIEYLKNMGVAASFSMSLVIDEKLWGLIACHHYNPKTIDIGQWKNLEFIANLYAHEINSTSLLVDHKKILDNASQRNTYMEMFSSNMMKMSYVECLDITKTFLRDILKADGLIIHFIDNDSNEIVLKDGEIPPCENVAFLLTHLEKISPNEKLISTHSLINILPEAKNISPLASGIVYLKVTDNPTLRILWMRKEYIQVTSWAGDPTKNVSELSPNAQLSPRSSFEIWKHTVKDQSIPWSNLELETVSWLLKQLYQAIHINHLDMEINSTKKLNEEQKNLNQFLEKRVNQEIQKNQLQEQILIQQSRLAQMGEMISMIAHQWRQPLNVLSILNQTILVKYQLKKLDDEAMLNFKRDSTEQIKYMSETIDSFRNFFSPEKEKQNFLINTALSNAIVLVKKIFENNRITILNELKNDFTVYGYEKEFAQVIVNLLKNAADSLMEKNSDEKWVKITCDELDQRIKFIVEDNGGGIPEEIIGRVFDPYFSTKLEKNGTGLGLYMSKMLIEDSMGGSIHVRNTLNGACFELEFEKPKL